MKLLKHLLNKERNRENNLLDRIYLDTANQIELQSDVTYCFDEPGFVIAISLERRVLVTVYNPSISSGKKRHIIGATDCIRNAQQGDNAIASVFVPANYYVVARALSPYDEGTIINSSEKCIMFTPIKIKEK